jgi:hypothetical protein
VNDADFDRERIRRCGLNRRHDNGEKRAHRLPTVAERKASV